jgi:3-hydroxymyristoyl/3-hydroxydecanoyl-(acyl carrier protein) dehydratase
MNPAPPRAGDLAAEFLPHTAPFLLLDRILAIDDAGGRFAKCLTRTDPLLGPTGVLAPLLMVEAMAQGAGIVLMRREPELRARGSAVLAAIDRCQVSGSVHVGDLMVIDITVLRRYGDMARVRGEASVGERRCATAALTLAFAPFAAGSAAP